MEAIIPSLMSAATQPLSIIFLVFLLVVFGILIPRDRYIELKDNLKNYETVTKGLLDEFKGLSEDFKELEVVVLKKSDIEDTLIQLQKLVDIIHELREKEGTDAPAQEAGGGRGRNGNS